MKRAIIIGATSGIGQEVAKNLLREGWQIGIAGRRQPALEDFQRIAPEQIKIQSLDITQADAAEKLNTLIRKLGGMDLFLLSSGIGFQNPELDIDIELNTARTNVEGFTRMVDTAFDYFKQHGGGHLAVISSIAGTKGLGIAPAYSATQKLNIRFTDIRPGFVATALLGDGKHYPMLMKADKVGQAITRALNRKRRTVIIDGRYRVLVFFWRLIPRRLWKRLPVKNKS